MDAEGSAPSVSRAPPIPMYGINWPAGTTRLTIELACFRFGGKDFPILRDGKIIGRARAGEKAEHFRNCCRILWPEKAPKGGGVAASYVHHPWSDWMVDEACANNWLALAGCASSGKSEFMAVWGIIDWLCAAQMTAVFVTSTTIRDAKKRVWGAVQRYWQPVARVLPGKMVDAPTPAIRYRDPATQKLYDQFGVFLIPAEKQKSKDIAGKMLGMKAPRVLVLADELEELSEALLDTCEANLSNNPRFQLIGASNPSSRFSPFGRLARPKAGWGSITVDSKEWETERGKCLHFDALQSPNWLAGENLWPILRVEKIEDALAKMDQNSLLFWRQFRGFWSPLGSSQCIYSEPDIVKFKASEPAVWEAEPQMVAALDPSWTSGGDRTIAYFAKVGRFDSGLMGIEFVEYVLIEEDATKTDEPRAYQIVRKYRDACRARKVRDDYAGFDATDIPFADIMSKEFSPRCLRVPFGGRASDLPVSGDDPRPASEAYSNRVTELWYWGYELLRRGQIRGLGPEVIKEMTARQYTTSKGSSMRVCVEPKDDMKVRTSGISPDIADAAFIALAVARERLGLGAVMVKGSQKKPSVDWRDFAKRADVAGRSRMQLRRA